LEAKDEGLSNRSYKDLSWKYAKVERKLKLIEQYESNGDLKSTRLDGSRSQEPKH
jgi:hypothetical protein